MDPSGPWAYTYNRIAVSGVSTTSATTSSSDFQQHNLTTVAGQAVSGTSPTPSTILLQTSNTSGNTGSSYTPGGFISSASASYEPVFNSIFQHTVPKPAHYNSSLNSHRQNTNAVSVAISAPEKLESARHNFSNHGQQQQQPNFYTEQSASGTTTSPTTNLASGTTLTWQGGNASHVTIGDPFSLLSQESIVQAASPESSGQQNTYSSQYQTPHTQLNQIKISRRSSSPQMGGPKATIQSVPSPITTVSVASSGVQTSAQYYRQPTSISSTFSDSSAQTGIIANTSKSFSAINSSSLNPTCILVTSPAVQAVSNQNVTTQKYAKKQNMYNNAARNNVAKNASVATTITAGNMVANNGNNHSFGIPTSGVKTNNQTLHLVQTKAQTKIYPELLFVEEQGKAKLAEIQQADPQDGSISYYTIIDGRLAYASGNANLIINESPKGRAVPNVQSARQFVLSNSAEIIVPDGSRIKTEPNYSISPLQSECTNAIVMPRKQSPSHSTSSQAPSPAYPIYNSPMNSIESPSQHSASSGTTLPSSENSGHIVIYKPNTPTQAQMATPSTVDASVSSRNVSNNSLTNTSGPVVYSSVITRALINEQGKVYSPQQTCWDNDIKPKKFYTINSGSQNEIIVPAEIQLKPAYYESPANNTHIGALHGLKTEEPQVTENILVTTDNPLASQIQITSKLEEPSQPLPPQAAPKSRRRRAQNSTKTREQLLSENEFLINRVPPRTKNAKTNRAGNENTANINVQQVQPTQSLSQQQQNGGTYYDNSWNAHQVVTQQVVFAGSSNTPSQIGNYGEQQKLQHLQQQQHQQQAQLHLQQPQQHQQQPQQHQQQSQHQQQLQHHHQQPQQHQPQHQQQFQQQPQQVLLTHQSSDHTQYPAQNPYYTSYHISPNVSGQLTSNRNSGVPEVPISPPELRETPMDEPNQKIITQITPNSCSSEVGNSTPNPDKEESIHQDEPGLKVVVPNIEEELGFLSSGLVESGRVIKEKKPQITPILKSSPQSTEPFKGKTFKVPNSAATGFMASYLKFLQGDRDSSPPPLGRAQKKPVYQKSTQPITANSSVQPQAPKSSGQFASGSCYKQDIAINKTIEKQSTAVTSVTDSVTSTVTLSQQPSPLRQVLPVPNQQQLQAIVPQHPTPVVCQEQNSKVLATVTTNFASTQTVNKKRKAVAVELDIEQNKQRKNNKVKNVAEIAVQTASHPVMLPKKARPQMAMQMASMQQQSKSTTVVPSVNQQLPPTSMPVKQDESIVVVNNLPNHPTIQPDPTYRYQQDGEEDPLNLPPRRETSFRKAKTRGIEEIMQKKLDNDDQEEPQEFADSDTDPVWTPEDEENELNKLGKSTRRKSKRPKTSYSRSRKPCSNILTAAVIDAGIDDSDVDNALNDGSKRIEEIPGNIKQQIHSPKGMKQEAINVQDSSPALLTTTTVVDTYRTGDFVILRSDLIKDWPVLWQVDGKSILQMFEPFSKDGKVLYKNMSKYAAWNNESKRLYVRAPVSIQSQGQNEIVVELNKSELYGSDAQQYVQKLMIDYLAYRENFEVYVQTLISQSLDQNFFNEITKEKDEYFLSNIKIIEDVMENCARKLLSITHMAKDIIVSIKTWPHCNDIADLGHSSLNQISCVGCRHPGATVRFLLYGEPYKSTTMQPMETNNSIKLEKDIMFCQSCVSRAKLLHKIVHEKYNLYQICSRKVQDQQIIDPGKGTTAILNDLLADSDWIDQLFSNVRNSWVEVESIERIVRFYQVSQ